MKINLVHFEGISFWGYMEKGFLSSRHLKKIDFCEYGKRCEFADQ